MHHLPAAKHFDICIKLLDALEIESYSMIATTSNGNH